MLSITHWTTDSLLYIKQKVNLKKKIMKHISILKKNWDFKVIKDGKTFTTCRLFVIELDA
jgi:hypothetical protein